MNKTQALVDHLRQHGPTTSRALAAATGLPDSGRVSALLNNREYKGQVEQLARGLWRLNPDWDDIIASELRDAQIVLERAGYTVRPPARGAQP